MEKLKDKTYLVTGGSTGIGRAIILALARQGAHVFTFARHIEPINDLLKIAEEQSPGQVHGIVADQSSYEDVQRVFKELDKRFGNLDGLVNNASVSGESITDTDYAAWKYVIDSNLVGYLLCCQLAYHRMLQKGGHIINIGSTSAVELEAGGDIYIAAKAGIQGFSASLQKALGEKNIRVSLLEPGSVGTDMTLTEGGVEEQRKEEAEGKMLMAEDIAEGVLFILQQPTRSTVSLLRIEPRITESE